MADNSGPPRTWDRNDVLPIVLFLVLFLLTFREFFFADKSIFDRDVTLWEVPVRKLCTQLLKDGGLALWTDAYGGGQPFLANPKNAVLYPAGLLYLIFPFFAAFKLYYFIHVVVTWIGIYFLGKTYALSRRAAFLSASLFIFGGMYLSSFEFYNHIAALAWLPWIMVFLIRPVRRWLPRLTALAALWTFSILAGAPEITLITLTLAALQILFLAHDRARRLALAAASLLLALLLSAAQLVPSFALLKQSERTSARFAEWSLEGVQLLNLPFANILGSDREPGHERYWAGHFFDRGYPLYYSLYIGLGALLLALWALGRLRNRKVLYLGVAILVFFLLASGKYSPLSGVLQFIPLVSWIRYPVKFLVGSMFSISLLAAMGFDAVFVASAKKRVTGRSFGPVLAALGLLFALLSHPVSEALSRFFDITQASDTAEVRASLLAAALLAALLALPAFASRLAGKWRRLGSVLFAAIVILDLVGHNRHINPLVPTSLLDRPAISPRRAPPFRLFRENDVPRTIQRGNTEILRLALYARQTVYPLTGVGDGLFYLFDEDTLDIYPREYRSLTDEIGRRSRDDRIRMLRAEGCEYYVSHDRMPGLTAEEKGFGEGKIFFSELPGAASTARIVHRQAAAASLEDKVRAVLEPGFDPDRDVILDQPLVLGLPAPGGNSETLEILESRQGLVRARAAVSADGIIIFPGNFAKGWRARVDDRPVKVFRANLSSKGILVSKGRHEVELKYAPVTFKIGAAVSLASLLGLVMLILLSVLKRGPATKPGCLALCDFL